MDIYFDLLRIKKKSDKTTYPFNINENNYIFTKNQIELYFIDKHLIKKNNESTK